MRSRSSSSKTPLLWPDVWRHSIIKENTAENDLSGELWDYKCLKPKILFSLCTINTLLCLILHVLDKNNVFQHLHTFPSLSSGESKLSRNLRNTWSSVHSPFRYLGWCLTLYTPLRSSIVITPSPVLSSFLNACSTTSFLALDMGGCNHMNENNNMSTKLA